MTLVLLFVAATLWTALGIWALLRVTRSQRRQLTHAPPVSILKPLCGVDADLEANLESFFSQSYPSYEVVFGIEGEDEALARVVQKVRARFPAVPCRTVHHLGGAARNPKVRNLLAMLEGATHDLFVISDSNVRVSPDYLEDLVATRVETGAGIVTNVIAGVGERSLGAAVEAVQLNGFCAAGAALPTLLGEASVIGKSMLMSRRELDALGGLHKVADVLAEDFVLGKMFQHGGGRVVLARTVVQNVTGGESIASCFGRHRRWATLRWRVKPAPFVLELLTSPVVLIGIVFFTGGSLSTYVPWAFFLSASRDLVGWVVLRGAHRWYLPILFGPLRELVSLGAWIVAPWKRRVAWRGTQMQLGAGTILFEAKKKAQRPKSLRPAGSASGGKTTDIEIFAG